MHVLRDLATALRWPSLALAVSIEHRAGSLVQLESHSQGSCEHNVPSCLLDVGSECAVCWKGKCQKTPQKSKNPSNVSILALNHQKPPQPCLDRHRAPEYVVLI